MKKILAAAFSIASLIGFSSSASHAALIYGTNVIVNGDAEADVGSNGLVFISPTGWTNSSNTNGIIPVFYGAPAGYPSATDPGPVDRGLNFFGGTISNPLATLTQVQNISNVAAAIDGGLVSYSFSAWLGGFSTQDDQATFSISFLDASSAVLSAIVLGPVTRSDRNDLTGLLFRSTSGFIPTGTRDLLFTLTSTRFQGTANDGYADNLSFIAQGPLDQTPVPAALPLFATGLGILGFAVHRQWKQKKI
jgi:hypothetical protein